ncbi:MAG: aminopeptidase N [SAR324 cluster bacterium]|jgi:aminopeptidase N|nr:aminopeptidase N [SAR324 cluster bacterium]
MKHNSPQTTYLKDYTPPPFLVDKVDLEIDLGEDWSTVKARLCFRSNPDFKDENSTLVLDGQNMKLQKIHLDNMQMNPNQYSVDESHLKITNVPKKFELKTEVRIKPQNNTELEGLYKSGEIFCTQCESEGFRKITYFFDRPDVMSLFSTKITANKEKYPVILSNGNPVESGEMDDGRHWIKWEDPHPKPSYLFALVAGDLLNIEDKFTTASGRDVTLKIYVEPENIEYCKHAMRSLKESMRWDEERFGREYDLDLFMIVAVNDFNSGAMENKGLNIFNSKLILASQDTATDTDYYNIQGVVGHEYFHNWSGNRVTCRDWFQLSLKEGFTVFRDQEFSSDLNSRAVQRVADVDRLRAYQFPEDAGPMSHPVRPDSYMEINNFYTMTVYEKGAEVVRMISTLLGKEDFRRGTDLYFSRYDGQAVTCDDFVGAMEEANNKDLEQFKRWYNQSGTPELRISGKHDQKSKKYTLTVHQSCPSTPGQKGFGKSQDINTAEKELIKKQPFHIPLAMGLLSYDGQPVPLKVEGDKKFSFKKTLVLEIRNGTDTFVFEDINDPPVPSLLRGFSAPVKLYFDYSNSELALLLANDTDKFNRWEAGQQLMIRVVLEQVNRFQQKKPLELSGDLLEAFKNILEQSSKNEPALLAQTLSFPPESYLGEIMDVIDVVAIHETRKFTRKQLAKELHHHFEKIYSEKQEKGSYSIDPESMGRRSLKNVCLGYLAELNTPEVIQLCSKQFNKHGNMTDVVGALGVLTHIDCPERETAFNEFEKKWNHNTVVMDKWFTLQAISNLPGTLQKVLELTGHPAYDGKNPNKIRALISAFSRFNQLHFHSADGSGYEFIAEQVLKLDPLNPQTAARLVSVFNNWKKFEENNKIKMKDQLNRIVKTPELSGDVFEIVSKALGETA